MGRRRARGFQTLPAAQLLLLPPRRRSHAHLETLVEGVDVAQVAAGDDDPVGHLQAARGKRGQGVVRSAGRKGWRQKWLKGTRYRASLSCRRRGTPPRLPFLRRKRSSCWCTRRCCWKHPQLPGCLAGACCAAHATRLPVELLEDLDGRRLLPLQAQAVHAVGQVDGAGGGDLEAGRGERWGARGRWAGLGECCSSTAAPLAPWCARASVRPAGRRLLHAASINALRSPARRRCHAAGGAAADHSMPSTRSAPPGSASCTRQSRCRWRAPARRWRWAAPAAPG